MSTVQLPELETGTWIQDGKDRWHASIAFDGERGWHSTACDVVVIAPDNVKTVEMDPPEVEALDTCDHCVATVEMWNREGWP